MDSNWQPIETAPKDGTEIIAIDDRGEYFVAFWHEASEGWYFGLFDEVDGKIKPTHWMPLPAAPTTEGEN